MNVIKKMIGVPETFAQFWILILLLSQKEYFDLF